MVTIEPSYARNYTTLEELLGDADLVVQARVESVVSSGYPADYIPFTRFQVTVERALKGSPANPLLVTQVGAKTSDFWFEAPESPLMRVGERYILFLKSGQAVYGNQTHESVGILGECMGRFSIEGGNVRSLNTLLPAAKGLGPVVDNVPLDRFWATLESLAGPQ